MSAGSSSEGPLWEVFLRPKRGLSHTHAGSLHAPDARTALRNARDVYTRRSEAVSIWVVPAAAITASVLAQAQPGAIILLHPMHRRRASLEAVPAIIEGLQARGLRLVTVSELLAASNDPRHRD